MEKSRYILFLFWTIKNVPLRLFSVKDIDTEGTLKLRQNVMEK